ncbi:MAG: hypothetical protein CMH13_00180 [Martelella sp.]|uniref:hypothetical protein n=1 Tax=unclassified Martelella TaxID=2629616 RepID=UPI000C3CF8AE|nr:hypothetical protein [Martelella sp.]MAU18939.1 hypothetical protein [Martelella sp.]|tara:strand:- start:179 stop:391 length:213 start_codon:yes stop_codon:yes gene_type:complete
MKFSSSIRFNLEYMLAWFVVRVLRLNIPWCMRTYKEFQLLVHGVRSAEPKGRRETLMMEELGQELERTRR